MKFLTTITTILVASITWAAATTKYSGNVDFTQNRIHKDGIKGAISLNFEGDALKSVVVKPTVPVFGKTELTSSEQAVFSTKAEGANAQMAIVWKLAGAPHKWYYVFISKTTDAGKTFAGDIFKGDAPLDVIQKALESGTAPGEWVKEGVGTLTAQ